MSKWLNTSFGAAASGLKNIQGQLTEFTKEVLAESTEEIQDPETELQVFSVLEINFELTYFFNVLRV
jgi:hypothetical protein